ncbi:MAG: glycosyltransferase family protein [Clostridia bacterium]|nr:glycosyltransferase family protein [Clostridia bacterium]
MRTVAIIQARMSSSRLPGKVMLPLRNNERVIDSVYNRIGKSKLIDEVVIATSVDDSDNEIQEYGQKKGYSITRGSLDDVLGRFYHAAKQYEADTVVRITADCPLVDYMLNDELIQFFRENDLDYAGIKHGSTALGIPTEVCSFSALERAYNIAVPPHREHVTTFMYNNPDLFKCSRVDVSGEYSDSRHYRLTLDTKEDYEVIKAAFENIKADYITIGQVNEFLKNNECISKLNCRITQKTV